MKTPFKETKLPKVIYCKWVDAVSDSGWEDNKKSGELHLCYAIGFLIKETDDFLTLATNVSQNENSVRISIPKAWIKDRKTVVLNVGQKKKKVTRRN